MIRFLPLSFAAPLLLFSASVCADCESFPVVHNDPITVRILGGEDAHPLAHLHLILTGGYQERDIRLEMWREEILTDSNGNARLPPGLANLPLLQVRVAKKHLCMDAHQAAFSIDRIRRDGLSSPNHCGIATVLDVPGVLNVFAMSSTATLPKRSALCVAIVASKVAGLFHPTPGSAALPAAVIDGATLAPAIKPVPLPLAVPNPAPVPIPQPAPSLSPPRNWHGLLAFLPPLGILR